VLGGRALDYETTNALLELQHQSVVLLEYHETGARSYKSLVAAYASNERRGDERSSSWEGLKVAKLEKCDSAKMVKRRFGPEG